ncbi:hypothetical protein D3C83_186730 [compost metagenome]
MDEDVEVARRGTATAGLSLAGKADASALVDARRDIHLERLLAIDAAFATA